MSQVKQLYESDRVWDQAMQLGQKNLLQALVDFLPEDASTILDVGCGDGKITQQLIAASGKKIIGLDSSEEALSRCTFETVLGDATELDFADSAFDAVMTTDMLEHLPDEIEKKAWQELFRVAAKTVLVAVPFREELLEATTRCEHCHTLYHVNWHMRSYDWVQLTQRAPVGWRAVSIVLTGEAWSPYHPIETHFRRELLDEWSGWCEALCPECGSLGKLPEEAADLPCKTAAALGKLIYADANEHGIARTHSEILVVYRHDAVGGFNLGENLHSANANGQNVALVHIFKDKLETNLLPYPLTGRAVEASDGGIVVQLPVYAENNSLHIVWKNKLSKSIVIIVEDGLGKLFTGEVKPDAKAESVIELPRLLVSGYFGVLVRFAKSDSVTSIGITGGMPCLALTLSETTSTAYHRTEFGEYQSFIQVTTPMLLNVENLSKGKRTNARPNWKRLFEEIEQFSVTERDALVTERDALVTERDTLVTERDTLVTERDTLVARPEVRLSTRIRNRLKQLEST